MGRIVRIAVAAITITSSVASIAAGQTTTGAITGVIRDAASGVLPGVTVKATHEGTNAETAAVSNDEGVYVLRGLPVGRYTVVAERQGFQAARNTNVVVRVNEDVRLDIGLKVGAVTETVTVSGTATTVDTTSGTLRTVVDQERIENLPLNGRNATQLMTLVAGVLPDRSDLTSGATYPGTQPVSSSGARGNTTNYVLDGGYNNDHYSNGPNPMPNPDALQEFSVQTNSFSAEYGRNVGAIVNAVTRAGTNQFHGLGFGYFRHYKLNATNFFTPGVDDGLKRSHTAERSAARSCGAGLSSSARTRARTRGGAQRRDRAWSQRQRCGAGISRPSRASCATRLPASPSRTTRSRHRSSARPPFKSWAIGCPSRTQVLGTTR